MADWANAAAVLANKAHSKNGKGPIQSGNVPALVSGNRTGQIGSSLPNGSSASAKAALLAHRSSASSRVDMQLPAKAARESIKGSHDRALLAATKSMGSTKPAGKPVVPLMGKKEAELAQRMVEARRMESESRNRTIHIRKEMLTEHPPIRMEIEERRHQDALRASAVSLARTVYSKNKKSGETNHASGNATGSNLKQDARQYLSLQDAAQRMAAERLARIKDPEGTASLRNYYGYPEPNQHQSSRPANLLHKVRHPWHRRSASEGEEDSSRSQHVRSQMALLQAQIAHVDTQKLAQDRARLMAAAEKKVHLQMHKLDEKVFSETGKMSPLMMSEWDAKARERMREHNQTTVRETKPDSAVDVGAGRLVDRSDVENLAIERVGPTLRRIDLAVEKRRAEEADQRSKEEEKKRAAREERERKREERAEKKKSHEEERRNRAIKGQQSQAGNTVEEIIEGKDNRESAEGHAQDGGIRIAIPILERFSNHFTRHRGSLNDEARLDTGFTSQENASIAEIIPVSTSAESPSNTHQTQTDQLATNDVIGFGDTIKTNNGPVWKKLAPKRPKSDHETVETTQNSQPSTSSRIKSAFARRKGNKAHNIITMPKRKDGDSTELEDSSDMESFHSTTSSPQQNIKGITPAQDNPQILISGTEESHASTSGSQRNPTATHDVIEGEERPHQENRRDKLKGVHLETRFHEEL